MDKRNQWAFWGLGAAAFLIVCIPSTLLLEALARYKRSVDGMDVVALRPVRVRLVPHRDGRRAQMPARLEFVDFSLRKPRAKKVALIGDFNAWKDGSLPLARQSDGRWALTLPLPRGRHGYLFVVDGQAELDPANAEAAEVGGRRASIKTVR